MNVLVTGGAGYIGSHATKALIEQGHRVVVVDNLYRGHKAAVHPDAAFVHLDLRATGDLAQVMMKHEITCVMHFAALAYVGESVHQPMQYYDNNTIGGMSLVKAMDLAKVKKMIFSSTCATYGQPEQMPMDETLPQAPMNPYGMSKLMTEHVLRDYAAATPDFAFAALRYFNVAGSAADGSVGEDHEPETHLIPLLLLTALGQRSGITIFGDDYPTPDGSCIRDYIHVEDLVGAHLLVMQHLQPSDQRFYNLGIGKGLSVKEVVESARRVTGHAIPAEVGDRRAGDPAELFASSAKIQSELGWRPRYTEIDPIVETAWRWFKSHPHGYAE